MRLLLQSPAGHAWACLLLTLLLGAMGCDRASHSSSLATSEAFAALHEQPAEVTLGDPSLTVGIPGEGPLSVTEIEAWLAIEANHRPLEVSLPPHLREAAEAVQIPADNPLTRAKIELGRQIFFDRRLAGNDHMMCADCHYPKRAYTMYLGTPEITRDPLPAFNRILGTAQFWDGHAANLREQPHTPIKNAHEMNTTEAEAVEQLAGIEGYRLQFEAIFGRCDFEALCMALASFERAIVTGPCDWDKARLARSTAESSDSQAMSPAALRGETLFFSDRLQCGYCHSGPNLTDEQYHNIGIGMDRPTPSTGRFGVTGDPTDQGAFKTPTLRNVTLTSPYMHDGRFNDLHQVIDWFDQGGHANENLSPLIGPLNLAAKEKADLLAFLESLTTSFAYVEEGRLPVD